MYYVVERQRQHLQEQYRFEQEQDRFERMVQLMQAQPAPVQQPQERQRQQEQDRFKRMVQAQLRCGYSSVLHSYLHRIGAVQSDACPSCGTSPHDIVHFLSCPTHRHAVSPADLWRRPAWAAEIL